MDTIQDMFNNFQIDPFYLYDSIVRSSENYIYIGDLRSNMFIVSDNMLADFDLPSRVFPNLIERWGELVHEKDKKTYEASIACMLCGETDEHNVEYQIRNRKNEYIWVHCRGVLKRDAENTPVFFAGVVTKLQSKGKVNFTTGLFRQSECEKRINSIFEKNPGTAKGGILLLGLDNFTRINNLNNHIFGDSVLRQFAQAVQALLPGCASMYRHDGDQFSVICENCSKKEIYSIYQQIQGYSNRRHEVDGIYYFCTVSGGIALFEEDSGNYLDLIKYATSALEESKKKGRNTCTFFSPGLMQNKLRSMKLVELLQSSALQGMRHFHLVYQPLTDAQTMRVSGAEVLLRWECDDFGSVSPAEFIPLLEESELISSVGKWVLEQAVITCKEWTSYHPEFVMNINVSYLQMLDEDFSSYVKELLERHRLPPRHIILELTESRFVTDMQFLKDTFRRLRDIPVRIAMDDFGTGYSSLGMLAQSPADVVKIDRVFVKSLRETDFNRSFIGAIVQLCHSVGIRVCVEGVEESSDLKIMQSLKVDSIQGFYFSKPITKEDFFARYLRN